MAGRATVWRVGQVGREGVSPAFEKLVADAELAEKGQGYGEQYPSPMADGRWWRVHSVSS
jgi:hypothetical protein